LFDKPVGAGQVDRLAWFKYRQIAKGRHGPNTELVERSVFLTPLLVITFPQP